MAQRVAADIEHACIDVTGLNHVAFIDDAIRAGADALNFRRAGDDRARRGLDRGVAARVVRVQCVFQMSVMRQPLASAWRMISVASGVSMVAVAPLVGS